MEATKNYSQVLEAFYRDVLSSPNPGDGALEAFTAAKFQDDGPQLANGSGPGVVWTSEGIESLRSAFQNLEIRPVTVEVGSWQAMVQWEATGYHRRAFAGWQPVNKAIAFSGTDVVMFDEDDRFTSHFGWIDARSLDTALAKPSVVARNRGSIAQPPARSVLDAAGIALEHVAAQQTAPDKDFGWDIDLDAPRWALTGGLQSEKSFKSDQRTVLRVVFGGAMLASVIAVGLILLFFLHTRPRSSLLTTAVVIGGWTAVALYAAVVWHGITANTALSRLHLRIRRTTPLLDWSSAPSGYAGDSGGTSPPSPTPSNPRGTAPTGSGTATVAHGVAKEPVLLASLLTAGGTLAIGLPTGLSGSTVAAIAAGAIAVAGILVRMTVTPLANPKDSQGNTLTPTTPANPK